MIKNTLWCIAWICGVASSNVIITNYGPAYSVLTAFALIGLSITSRDFLHEAWSENGLRWKLGALISSGGALSYLIQEDAGRIALASVIAFTLSETVDSVPIISIWRVSLAHHPGPIYRQDVWRCGMGIGAQEPSITD